MHKSPQQMLLHWEQAKPDHVYLRQPIDRQWHTYDWRRTMDEARRIAAALRGMGLEPGDRVGLLSKNCAHWFIADFAIMLGGFVSVPIYPTANTRTIGYVVDHSGCKACFVGKLDDPASQQDAFDGSVPTIAFPYPTLSCDHQWDDLLSANEPLTEVHEPTADETITLIYTSGSTGNPKGAVHSYASFAFVGARLGEVLELDDADRAFSYLPLAHCTERAYVEAASIYHNGRLHFAESLDTFAEDLRTIRPTLFGSVPRLWKRFQLGVFHKIPESRLDRLLALPLVRSLIQRRILRGLGLDAVRWCASGTAPIAPSLLQWYEKLGLDICQGWGMTETLAYGTQTGPSGENRLGTIGRALPELELKIDEQGEILVKGPCLMDGYYREPELTADTFDAEGFLKTGDRGEIDADGYVTITGRAKEIFKTAKGKYVAPVPIESLLAQNPLIELSCVMGLGMPQPVALVQLAEGGVGDRELARSRLHDTLTTVNAGLESHERLSRLVVVKDSWTPENGLLTPTLKLRREIIEKRYDGLVRGASKTVEFEVEHAL